jgi:Protein of unknown function (DUF1647)
MIRNRQSLHLALNQQFFEEDRRQSPRQHRQVAGESTEIDHVSAKIRRLALQERYFCFVAAILVVFIILNLVESWRSTAFRDFLVVSWTRDSDDDLNETNFPCQYDGECPTRMICGANGNSTTTATSKGKSKKKGVCVAIPSPDWSLYWKTEAPVFNFGSTSNTNEKSCLDACLTELRMDELFFQGSWPTELYNYSLPATLHRPESCLITFSRTKDPLLRQKHWQHLSDMDRGVKWNDVPPSIRHWVETRFRSVVRTDPVSGRLSNSRWLAYCSATCSSDSDCFTLASNNASRPPPFSCQKQVCQRNPAFWKKPGRKYSSRNVKSVVTAPTGAPNLSASQLTNSSRNDEDDDSDSEGLIVVTGASITYFMGLDNLAGSLRHWAPKHKLVVYNLGGLRASELDAIRSWSNVLSVEWPDGVPNFYPPHVHHGKTYAWKPIIINETVHRYGKIFWLDAGSTVTGSITPVNTILERDGIMLMRGQDEDMLATSHPATYKWFNTTKATANVGPHFAGNTQAYMYPSRWIRRLVIPNAACAWDVNCISPPGANLLTHRFDQTSMSILAYHPKARAPHYTEYLAAQPSQLNDGSSFKFVWTSRQHCVKYSSSWGGGSGGLGIARKDKRQRYPH